MGRGSLVVRASDSRPEGLGSMLDVTKYPPSAHGFTCRNCGGGDRGRVAIYRPFGEVSLSLNRTVTCMVLKANDRRTSCPCHDEFRGPRSDYVRQLFLRERPPNILTNFRIYNIHWYAKIKDEVEKLAYQLNEKVERTERPIRRSSKVMYGSTCADMQVDVMGECLSRIKHVVGVRSVFLAKRLHAV
ncbi:uncharacterized protein TNCV_539701 [Trichonephila clavipes]|nr:uncharacterized protein TNCV_539701 [Trichonephila clavipes]